MRTLFAIVAHEEPEFLAAQVGRIMELNPGDRVALVADFEFMSRAMPLLGGHCVIPVVCPGTRWGQLHRPLIEAMKVALRGAYGDFDFMTVVDSDQLPVRGGWTEALSAMPPFGWVGTRATVFGGAGKISLGIVNEARGVMRSNSQLRSLMTSHGWNEESMVWGFNPGSTYSASGMEALVNASMCGFCEKVSASKLFAPEETIMPTLVRVSGLDVMPAPGDHSLISYKVNHCNSPLTVPDDAFWVHPVPRRTSHPLADRLLGIGDPAHDRWNAVWDEAGEFSHEAFLTLTELMEGGVYDGVSNAATACCARAREAASPYRPVGWSRKGLAVASVSDWGALTRLVDEAAVMVADWESSPEKRDFVALLTSTGNMSVRFIRTCALLWKSDHPTVESRHRFNK